MNEKKTDLQRDAEGFLSDLGRMAREAAYRQEQGRGMTAAVEDLVRTGVPLSTAKKRVDKEARRLADAEAERLARQAVETAGAFGIALGRKPPA